MRRDVFSRDYASLNLEMFSASVDAGFVFALPFYHGDLEPDCAEVSTRGASPSVEREEERCSRSASDRLMSFIVEGRGSWALPRSSWRTHRCCGRSAFAAPVDTLTLDSQVA